MDTFENTAQKFAPLIKFWIKKLRLTHNYEDMYQTGLLALWEAYDRYDSSKGEFAALAKAQVRGRLLSELRKEVKDLSLPVSNPEERETSYVEVSFNERLNFLEYEKLLTARETIFLKEHFYKGRSVKQISQAYGVSDHTVRSWKKAMVKKLRNHFVNS